MDAAGIRDYFEALGTTEDAVTLRAALRRSFAVAAVTALALALGSLGATAALGLTPQTLLGLAAAGAGVAAVVALGLFASIRSRLGRQDQALIPRWLLLPLAALVIGSGLTLVAVAQVRGPNQLQAAAVVAIELPTLLLLAPVLLVTCLFVSHHFRNLTQVLRFDAVSLDELPPRVAAFFAGASPDIEAAGFRRVGDFRQKSEDQQFTRAWRGGDGTVYAEATVARLLCAQMTCQSCVSLLADGTLVESGTAELPQRTIDDRRLCMRSAPEANFSQLLDLHRATLAELRADHGDPLPLTLDDYQVVSHYGILLTHRRMIREGLLAATPYEPLAEQLEQSIESLIAEPAEVVG